MDAASKLLILMVLMALLIGAAVRVINKDYNVENIYRTNKNYYPSVTDKSVFGK